jgi:hypothetical protein
MQGISAREEINKALAQQAHDRNVAAARATERAAEEKSATAKEERAAAREQIKWEGEHPIVDETLIAAYPKLPLQSLKGQRISRTTLEKSVEAPKAETEPLVQVQTPKGVIWTPRSEAIGKPAPSPASATKPPTAVQLAAKAFYNRANEAVQSIETAPKGQMPVEDRIAALPTAEQFALHAPNFMQSPDIQAYNQAKGAFAIALLRKESGAAISQSEYDAVDQRFFIQPGDKPSTIARKRKARKAAIDGLQLQASESTPSAAEDEAYQEYLRLQGAE